MSYIQVILPTDDKITLSQKILYVLYCAFLLHRDSVGMYMCVYILRIMYTKPQVYAYLLSIYLYIIFVVNK